MADSRLARILTAPFVRMKAAAAAFAHPGAKVGWMLPGSRFNYGRSVGDGTSSSVVMAPLRWLQRNSTQAPLRISQQAADGKWTPIEPGDKGAARLLDLLDQPNAFYDGDALEEATTLSEELDGNAYWRKVRNPHGAVVEIWWIPHTLIEPVRKDGSPNFIDHYLYTPGGMAQPEEIPVEDIVHHRIGIDPANTMKGMSPFKSVLREVFTDNEAATYTAALLKNMGVPGVIMTPKGDDPNAAVFGDDLKDTKRKLEQTITGDNRGRAMVLDGAVDLHVVGFNPQQMSLRELRRLPEERVTAVMGVPAIVANLGAGLDRSTFANMQEAREAAAEEALVPRWRRRARTIKHQLLPDFEGARAKRLRVDHDLTQVRLLQEDEDKKADRNLRLFAGGAIELAELREELGKPVDDSHRIYLRPLQSIEVPAGMTMAEAMPDTADDEAAAGDGAVAEAAAEGGPKDDAPPADEPKAHAALAHTEMALAVRMKARGMDVDLPGTKAGRVLSARNASTVQAAFDALREVLVAAGLDPDEGTDAKGRWSMLHVADAEVKRLSRAQQGRLIQALDIDARAMEAPFAKRLEGKFTDLGKHVASVWAAEAAKGRQGDGTKDDGDPIEMTPHDVDVAMRTIALAEVTKWHKDVFTPEYGRHYDTVARQTLKTLTATLGLEWGEKEDEIAVRVLREHGKQVGLVDLAGQTKAALFSALAHGKAEGEGVDALERRIRQYVTDGSAGARVSSRALRIARTETMHAQRVSTREAYQASGVYDAVVAWDDRLGYGDDDCSARNGTVFTFDDAESEEAEEHPNGTLSWAPTTVRED